MKTALQKGLQSGAPAEALHNALRHQPKCSRSKQIICGLRIWFKIIHVKEASKFVTEDLAADGISMWGIAVAGGER